MNPTRILFLLDFDGTLAPIRRNPARAQLSKKTRATLVRLLQAGHRVDILSARPRAFLQNQFPSGVRIHADRGNSRTQAHRKDVQHLFTVIQRLRPPALFGFGIKKTRISVELHYRNVSRAQLPALRRFIARVTAALGVQKAVGRKVIAFLPVRIQDKAAHVRQLVKQWSGPVYFFGDDDSDAAAMRALRKRPHTRCFLVATNERQKTPRGIRIVRGVSGVRRELQKIIAQTKKANQRGSS